MLGSPRVVIAARVTFGLGRFCQNMRIGNLKYAAEKIELGSLRGNVFEIVLRDVCASPVSSGPEAEHSDESPLAVSDATLHEVWFGSRILCHWPAQHQFEPFTPCASLCFGLRQAVEAWAQAGFINYFGLQRFGSYSVGTHDVGKQLLKGDFEAAVNLILCPRVRQQRVFGQLCRIAVMARRINYWWVIFLGCSVD